MAADAPGGASESGLSKSEVGASLEPYAQFLIRIRDRLKISGSGPDSRGKTGRGSTVLVFPGPILLPID
jgi:hypothetical protein